MSDCFRLLPCSRSFPLIACPDDAARLYRGIQSPSSDLRVATPIPITKRREKERRGGGGGGKSWLLKSSSVAGAIERALRSNSGVLYDRFAAPGTERALEPDVRQGDLASRIIFRLSASSGVGVIAMMSERSRSVAANGLTDPRVDRR